MPKKSIKPKIYKVEVKDYILYFFERIFLAVFVFLTRFIPIKYFYPLATLIGKIGSFIFPPYKRRVLGNLELAFGPEKTAKEKIAIFREAGINMIKNYFEMLAAVNPKNRSYLIQTIQVEGKENLEASLKKGNGVIAIGGHLGSFTLIGIKMQAEGFDFHTIARGITDPLRKNVYEKYRRQQGQPFIYTRTSREAFNLTLQALKKNGIVFLIVDENRRYGGVFVNFFNRLASTTPGPALLHLRTGADIIPLILLRNPDNTHRLIIEPPLNPIATEGNQEEKVRSITQLITHKIEEYVRCYPAQWLWTNRRWRTRPSEEKAKGKTDPAYRYY